jgi:hypothetical protein
MGIHYSPKLSTLKPKPSDFGVLLPEAFIKFDIGRRYLLEVLKGLIHKLQLDESSFSEDHAGDPIVRTTMFCIAHHIFENVRLDEDGRLEISFNEYNIFVETYCDADSSSPVLRVFSKNTNHYDAVLEVSNRLLEILKTA